MTVAVEDAPKRVVYQINGPNGNWTQGFNQHEIETLRLLGLIVWEKTTSHAEWETHFYVINSEV